MKPQYHPPLKIQIPLPSRIEHKKGPHASNGYGGNLRVRMSNDEYDRVKAEANKLEITIANFCRWVIVYSASALKKHRDLELDTIGIEVEDAEGSGLRRKPE
jgi:hypothetical protein